MAAPHLYETMRPRSRAARSLGFAIHWFNHVLFRHWFHLEVYGLDNLPDTGPFILAPNHTSYLDVPVILGPSPSVGWKTSLGGATGNAFLRCRFRDSCATSGMSFHWTTAFL